MSDIITDIKVIRIKTDYAFSLSECKNAYEEAGRDVDKAIETLKSKIAPVEVKEMTEEEKADWEKYKKGAERRANRKVKFSSRRKRESIFLKVMSIICFVCFIVFLIVKLTTNGGNDLIIGIVMFGIVGLITLCVGVSVGNMTDEEYSKASKSSSTSAESVVYLHYDNEAIQCPHCGSTNILLKEKKFSKSKAFIGMTAFGIKGAVFGIPSHKRVKCCCADCGHKFEAVRR